MSFITEAETEKAVNEGPIPEVTFDDYDVQKQLGEGGFGRVYLAESKSGEEVAIKIFDIE